MAALEAPDMNMIIRHKKVLHMIVAINLLKESFGLIMNTPFLSGTLNLKIANQRVLLKIKPGISLLKARLYEFLSTGSLPRLFTQRRWLNIESENPEKFDRDLNTLLV